MMAGYEQDEVESQAPLRRPNGGNGGYSSAAAVSQLFARLSQEIEEKQPKNCIHFIVGFLCKHYPEHLHGFASIWQMDPDLERERHEVVNFFKAHKISTAVAAHFTNAGYDTLDTLTTLTPDSLVDVEAFNNVKWLPGHKVRLQQIFGEISARVRAYRQELERAQNSAPSPRAAARQPYRGQVITAQPASSPQYGQATCLQPQPIIHRPAAAAQAAKTALGTVYHQSPNFGLGGIGNYGTGVGALTSLAPASVSPAAQGMRAPSTIGAAPDVFLPAEPMQGGTPGGGGLQHMSMQQLGISPNNFGGQQMAGIPYTA